MKKYQQGFTLIEMMVVLSLLAILAAASLPLIQQHGQRQKEEELRSALRSIRQALDDYHQASVDGRIEKLVDESGYPEKLRALVDGVVDKNSPNGKKIYFLRSIPRDPFCDCAGKTSEDTWQTRSSISPPGNFSGGKDIFDVASTSQKIGSNGVPYAQW